MAEKSSRLAEILKQEYQSKGAVGGITSAAGKRIREKMDVRNALFGGTGVGSLIGKKIFGKGYSATSEKQVAADKITSQTAPLIAAQTDKLDIISVNSQITAKNSMALPSMARDMNLMKLNIFKLVKLQGGTANTNKTDIFWQRSKAREAEYEQQFKKGSKTSPTKVEAIVKSEKGSDSGGMIGFLGSILGEVGEKFAPIIAAAGALSISLLGLKGTIEGIYNWFATTEIGKNMGMKPTEGGTLEKNGYSRNTNDLVNTAAGVGGLYAGAKIVSGASKIYAAGKATAWAGLEAATTSAETISGAIKQPTTKWGKFLKYLASNDKKLYQKVGVKLAQMTALATIPFGGWVMALVQFGFNVMLAYQIYEWWTKFNKEEEKSPTLVSGQEALSEKYVSRAGTGRETTSTPTTPSSANNSDMAQLIRDKFKAAGFSEIQAEAAVANAIAESKLDPNAQRTTNKEDSVGLFQMNRKGGLGAGYSVDQLKDPNLNIDLAIAAAKKSRDFVNATNIQDAVAAFVKDVERPADKIGAINKRTAIATGGNVTPTQSGISGSALSYSSQGIDNIFKELLASGFGNTYIDNSQNSTSNGGSSGGSMPQAEVMDTEFGKYLLNRMF